MLYAAVRSGADAVYLGAKDFSARRNAENFSIDELKTVVEYCHIRDVQVYLTLNILIKDAEFCDALNLAASAYNAGIDGIIVQDLGLAKILHANLPELPLHASTQMTIHTPSALPILKDLGFKQVVVGREMSLSELEIFCKEAQKYNIVVEAFVHGALCMSMSGQCLLSAFLGSRSGNRGLCAGPCRLPFKSPNGTGYDLSLKDLSLIDYIPTLYNIGVRSFKIEGRMKRPEYVAAATKACKDALVNGTVNAELQETLKNVFSRSGFTDGYLQGKLGRDMFGIRTKEDVVSADKAFPLLHEIYRKEIKKVAVSIDATIKADEPITLTLSDGKNTVTAKGDAPQKAKNKPTAYEDVVKNLTKFGDTPYYEQGITLELQNGLFIPASSLNALRRDATALLDNARSHLNFEPKEITYTPKPHGINNRRIPDIVIRVESPNQLPENLSGVSAVIFPLEADFEKIKDVINIIDIPRGIISESLIENRLIYYKEKGIDTCLCGNLSAVNIAKRLGFNIIADTGLNIHNSESAHAVADLGAKGVVLSTEMTADDIEALNSPIPKGVITYGNIPLMLFRNCPIKNGTDCKNCNKNHTLIDRKGVEFPVRCRMGYSELLNSVPLWLGDKNIGGIDFRLLYFTTEPQERVSEVINAFIKYSPADCKYTRGLFFRGTI
jgi:putative protease